MQGCRGAGVQGPGPCTRAQGGRLSINRPGPGAGLIRNQGPGAACLAGLTLPGGAYGVRGGEQQERRGNPQGAGVAASL